MPDKDKKEMNSKLKQGYRSIQGYLDIKN